ncbi:protein containing DUF1917 [mine drainage metagenome]|uniref:Protein containing DUF1917 n=1 Tax=mine drainage metagenome TaxID=410659 RepID=T1AW26_9ZZZZ
MKLSEPFKEASPSTLTGVYWIYAKRKVGKYPEPTERSGKWCIYTNRKYVDEIWKRIKRATEGGYLGASSKVATKIESDEDNHREAHVICVYTYDWKDEKDVMKIRAELRKLKIVRKIPYKADEDTMTGNYTNTTSLRISKYYE